MKNQATRIETIASLAALLLLLFACYQVLQPFLFDLLWAAILCHVTWPLYTRLRSLKLSANSAAFAMVLPIGVLLLAPFVTAGVTFTGDIERLLQWFGQDQHVWPAPPGWLQNFPMLGEHASSLWQSFADDSSRIFNLIRPYALNTSRWVLEKSIHLVGELMHMGLSVLTLFFFYRDGEKVAEHVVIAIQRLAGAQTQRIIDIVGSSLRAVVYGILGTALVQALASMLGFVIAGVPYAFVLGVIAFFLMVIPAAGTIVWLPVSGWLLAEGETGWAIFIAAWFLLFVGTIDNWLRPILISREVELPFILIVLGIFGGLLAFGFIGIFIGPTLLATSYALVLDWLIRHKNDQPPAIQ